MKKILSIILACVLALGCAVALGGCGKAAAESKQAFIASRDYYSDLVETLAAPVADIDAEAIADARAAGMSGKISLSAEGLGGLPLSGGEDASDGAFGFDVDFVSDGAASSGSVALTLLGETLNALFSSDGSDIAISLPDLLPRPLLITQEMLAGLNRSYPDYPDYDGEDLYSFDDVEWNDDFEWGGEGCDSAGFDPSYVTLLAGCADRFLNNVPESCYSSGKDEFRTAGGLQKLDCLTLEADGDVLMDALTETLKEIADDPGLEEIYGENTEAMREYLREAANGESTREIRDGYKDTRVKWSRFTKDGATVGERFNVKTPESEYTLDAGLDNGDEAFAFIKLTDDKQGSDLLNAESTVGNNKGKLDVRFTANDTKYTFSVNGKTTDSNGAKVTEADVKIGFGGISLNVFKLTTTVRACDENAIDFDLELSTDLPAFFFGGDSAFSLKLSADIRRDASAAPEAIDVSDAYTREEMESEAFGEELESALKDKYPKIFGLIENYRAAFEAAADAVEEPAEA